MFQALKDYFFLPLLKVSWSTVVYIVTFNFRELKSNFTLRFPLILMLGMRPFLQKMWFEWYKMSDRLQMFIFGVFDPASTARRILKNQYCPQETFRDYCQDVTSKQ